MTELTNAPDGYVLVAPSLHREEALVVQGLLVSSGIAAALVGERYSANAYTRQAPSVVNVFVPAEHADDARAVLSEQPVADAGDVGTE